MPQHYNSRGHKSLLKKHMMPPVEKKPIQEPQPIDKPPIAAEKPPVLDAGLDDGQGSSSSNQSASPVVDDNLILLGLGALILCSVLMVK
jgi:hypothetical protein